MALAHPSRVRIIEVVTEWGELSPTEIVTRSLCDDLEGIRGKKSHKAKVSHINYHCLKLEEAGFLKLVGTRPVRGGTEHFYQATVEALFPDDEWASLEQPERSDISRVVWQRLIPQVEMAMHRDTFDSRVDRMLAWGPLDLDEAGWKELATGSADWLPKVERIPRDAEKRLGASGEAAIRCTYGILAYESPPPQRGGSIGSNGCGKWTKKS